MATKSDLQRAFEALRQKQVPYNRFWLYYDGDQPLIYNSNRLKELFDKITARFTMNWCAVVVDSVTERIDLKGFTIEGDETATEAVERLWLRTEMNLDSDDAHKAAIVTGEAFVIAQKVDEEVQAFYNDPRLCVIFYDPENPRKKQFAAKWWNDEQADRIRLTLYYPDRFEYYVSTKTCKSVDSWKHFIAAETPQEANPTGEIPVFHLRRERRRISSELDSVLVIQDAINKLFADMMVQAEFSAFKQRFIISNADTSQLKNAPNEVWEIPQTGKDDHHPVQVGQFEADELSNFHETIDKLATTIAIITRTPKHYVMKQVGDPSGEALITMESPLVKKCYSYIERFSPVWADLVRYMTKLAGVEIAIEKITPIYEKCETVQPKTQAEIRQTNVNAGIPLKTQLRDEGWSEKQLDELEQDRSEEQKSRMNEKAQTTELALKAFDRGGPVE
jgi:hypothetical protein